MARDVQTIRPAHPNEAETLAAIHVRTWQEAYEGLMPADYLHSLVPSQRLPMWRWIFESSDRVATFVAEIDSQLVGFSCGGISNDDDAQNGTGEVWSIYLLKEYWGRGIGAALHDALIGELLERGYERATLWVMESNHRTRAWYERRGWTPDGSRKTDQLWDATIAEVRYRMKL